MVTLATVPSISNSVYAVGLGQGLYVIDPDNVPTLYDWAGGYEALLRMTRIFYGTYVPEDPLLGPLAYNGGVGLSMGSAASRTSPTICSESADTLSSVSASVCHAG